MSGVSLGPSQPVTQTNVLLEILGSSDSARAFTAASIAALIEILGTSESVQVRIDAYQRAKAEADAALIDLNLGRAAKAAYDDATAKSADAQALLEKARSDAAAANVTVSTADQRAQEIVSAAQATQKSIAADIEQQRKAHASWLETTKADLATKRAALDAAEAAVSRQNQQLSDAQAAAEAATSAANRAKAKAEDSDKAAKALAKQLQATLTGLAAG